MSLVDYEASSDEEESEAIEQPEVPQHQFRRDNRRTIEEEDRGGRMEVATVEKDPPRSQSHSSNSRLGSTVEGQGDRYSQQSEVPALILPDASLLLNSPGVPSHLAHMTDHASRVAVAMAENESRKRDLNRTSSSTSQRSKIPRGNLPHQKNIPDTVDGRLLPPQLSGRSNIVTEDLSKLFAKGSVGSSSQ